MAGEIDFEAMVMSSEDSKRPVKSTISTTENTTCAREIVSWHRKYNF